MGTQDDVIGSGIDVIAGQFQISDPMMKRELRLSFEDYQPYRVRVGDVRADMTYERGLMASYSPWENGDNESFKGSAMSFVDVMTSRLW